MSSRIGRLANQLRSPRRLALSLLGVVLAFIWIGQAVATIFLREAADPEKLAGWIGLSLTAYAIWNGLKVCFRKPVEPFEWTETEKEFLLASPLSRSDVIKFRLASVLSAALLKSTIFTFVMIPDLHWLPLGFLGMLLGLLIIDALRLILEVLVGGITPRERGWLKALLASLCIGVSAKAMGWTFANTDVMSDLSTAASFGFVINLLYGFTLQLQTDIGLFLTAPFRMVSEIVLTETLTMTVLAKLGLGLLAIVSAFQGLLALDDFLLSRNQNLEREHFQLLLDRQQSNPTVVSNRQRCRQSKRQQVFRLGGVGPLAWRQLQGAWTYRSSMLVAMGVPLALCCLPAFSDVRGMAMILNVIGGMTFYSFLLLPTSLKFDFRRDVDRLELLKSLPISPLRMVLGQIAAPVVLTFCFQAVVMIAAMFLNPFPLGVMLVALVAMLPLNVLIFGFENLVFMYYPHRMNQEGIHVFVRTILAFTAKGVVFALGLVGVITWMLASRYVGAILTPANPGLGIGLVFGIGLFLGLAGLSVFVVRLLSNAFDRFDPTVDLAGLD